MTENQPPPEGQLEEQPDDAEEQSGEQSKTRASEREQVGDLSDVLVRMLSPEADASTVRDYYLSLRRRGRGAPDAVTEVIDDFMEELRTAVAQEHPYNERHHRVRLGLPPSVQMNESLLPRSALVRRIYRERVQDRPMGRPH